MKKLFLIIVAALFATSAHALQDVVIQNPFPVPVAQADVVGPLSAIGALNATASVAMAGENGAGVLIAAGTLIGTVTPEVSYDATQTVWKGTTFFDPAAGTGLQTPNVVFASANPTTQLSITVPGGAKFIRVKVSSYTSGTANATLTATNANTPAISVPPAGLPVVVNGAIAGAAPGVAVASGNTVSVQNPSLDPCQTQAHTYTPISIATSIVKVIVTGTAAKKTYVCGLFLFAGGADNVAVFEATTATVCATAPIAVIGGGTTVATAASGIDLAANGGFELPANSFGHAATTVVNNDLCLGTSAAVQLSGVIVTAQQ